MDEIKPWKELVVGLVLREEEGGCQAQPRPVYDEVRPVKVKGERKTSRHDEIACAKCFIHDNSFSTRQKKQDLY